MLYALCGILRLVRFNVNAHAVKGDALNELTYHSNFTGLPIPAGAAGAVSLNLFVHSPSFTGWIHLSDTAKAIGLTCCMILLGYLMVCKWKFPSIKTLRIRVPFLYLLLFTVILAIFILYGIFYYLPLMLLVGSLGYIITGCTLTVIRLIAGKKSTTLVEFEPESEGEEEI